MKEERIYLRVTSEEKQLITTAAVCAGVSVSQWARAALRNMASEPKMTRQEGDSIAVKEGLVSIYTESSGFNKIADKAAPAMNGNRPFTPRLKGDWKPK